jgi:hypothetical protein
MQEVSDDWMEALKGPVRTTAYADVWWGPRMIFEGLPIADGQVTIDRDRAIKGSLSLKVPSPDGALIPYEDSAPLAENGQRIHVRAGLNTQPRDTRTGEETVSLGWFLIEETKWREQWQRYRTANGFEWVSLGAVIDVTAPDVSQVVADDQFLTPETPQRTGVAEIARLVEDSIQLGDIHDIDDIEIPKDVVYRDDRLKSIQDITDLMHGFAMAGPDGTLQLFSDRLRPAPVWVIETDSRTLFGFEAGRSRRDIVNGWVSTGQTEEDRVDVQGSAFEGMGPRGWQSYFGRKPGRSSNSLITSTAAAIDDARAKLQDSITRRAVRVPITCPPNYALQLADTVALRIPGNEPLLGVVSGLVIPLLGRAMQITVTIPFDDFARVRRNV